MRVATSSEMMLRIRSIDLKMGAMPKPRFNKGFQPPEDRIFR
jgi:hypothetical protein